jgi:predicted type IV restriction endonuclease
MDEGIRQSLGTLREEVLTWKGHKLTEQDTKNALIEPLLAALGWPKHDLRRVRAEYRHTASDNPVDYALFDDARPVVFVEAKALDRPLDDRKSVIQALNYANAANVEWAVLTNGAEWVLYDVFDRSDVQERVVFRVRVDDPEAGKWLKWICPANVRGGRLRSLKRFMASESRVYDELLRVINERDEGLVRLLAQRTRLDPRDVASALGTLHVSVVRPDHDEIVRHVEASPADSSGAAERRSEMLNDKDTEGLEVTLKTAGGSSRSLPSSMSETIILESPESGSKLPERPTMRAGLLPPAVPGSKPRLIRIGQSSRNVRSWKELLLAAIALIHEQDPAAVSEALTHGTFGGRKRRLFAIGADMMRTPEAIPGGFVETNVSADNVVSMLNRLLSLGSRALDGTWE